jgi:two-component system CheB/CheR fusion protein
MKTVPAQERSKQRSTVTSEASRRSLRILLVDDHPDTTTALERLLTRRGHTVAAAHDMRSAMETAERDQFDLLVSDVGLPDGSGLELMASLRAKSGLRGIAISGFGMNGDIEKSMRAGFSQHLVKPVNLEKLEAAIDHAMSVSG